MSHKLIILIITLLALSLCQKKPGRPPCRRCRNSQEMKWVYCNGQWRKLNKDQCLAVFVDPKLDVCKNSKNLDLFENFQGTHVWLWKDNKAIGCPYLNTCFCIECQGKEKAKEGRNKRIKSSKIVAPLISNSGLIQSTNFLQNRNYNNNEDKIFPIHVPDGQIIELKFEYFQLEYQYSCRYDWLIVRDKGDGSILLPKACGSTLPKTLVSHTNKVEIEFHSDYSVTRKGFSIRVSRVLSLSSVQSIRRSGSRPKLNRDVTPVLNGVFDCLAKNSEVDIEGHCNEENLKVVCGNGVSCLDTVKEVCQTDIKNEIISLELEGEINHIRPHALSLIPLFHLNFCPSKRSIKPEPFRKFKICCFHPFFDEEKGLTEEMKNDLRIKKAMCCKWTGNVFRFCGKRQRNDELPICSKEEKVEDIVVAGGYIGINSTDSTELIHQDSHHCALPPTPHVNDGGTITSSDGSSSMESLLLCGGSCGSSRSCLTFREGSWTATNFQLKRERNMHGAVHTPDGVLLIGGNYSPKTTEIVGGSEKFNLQHQFWYGCVIEDSEDYFVLTGGSGGGGGGEGINVVDKYNSQGFVKSLTSLNNPRFSHACGKFYYDNMKVYIVAGGVQKFGSYLDSTEMLYGGDASSWIISTPLPTQLRYMASISYDTHMVILGGIDYESSSESSIRKEILSFNGSAWTKVGKMNEARSRFSAVKVNINDSKEKYCEEVN